MTLQRSDAPTLVLLSPFFLLLIVSLHAASPGKAAPRPLYRDPPFDAPTDPVLCFNAEQNKWFMYYTARRAAATNAPGVSWVHGSNIGIAESSDGGATWTYHGTADISYSKDKHPDDYTYWAPEVIWVEGTYHMSSRSCPASLWIGTTRAKSSTSRATTALNGMPLARSI